MAVESHSALGHIVRTRGSLLGPTQFGLGLSLSGDQLC